MVDFTPCLMTTPGENRGFHPGQKRGFYRGEVEWLSVWTSVWISCAVLKAMKIPEFNGHLRTLQGII